MCIPTFQDVQVAAAVCGAPELFMILELETHWLVIIKIGQTPDLFLGQTSQFTVVDWTRQSVNVSTGPLVPA